MRYDGVGGGGGTPLDVVHGAVGALHLRQLGVLSGEAAAGAPAAVPRPPDAVGLDGDRQLHQSIYSYSSRRPAAGNPSSGLRRSHAR